MEVLIEPGQIGYVNSTVISGEVKSFKKEIKPLTEDPIGLREQLDQFLQPNWYLWAEIMSILSVVFTGEEQGLIRRAAMREWERATSPTPGPEVIPGEQKYPLDDPN